MNETHHCKFCQAPIGIADVNVSTDIALCRACGRTMPFSEIASLPGIPDADLQAPPKGVRIEEDFAGARTVTYKKISPVVWFLIPFTALWSGGSLTAIFGKQLQRGTFDMQEAFFGLPFLFGTVVMVSLIVYFLFGNWRVRFAQGLCEVSTGVGPLRWTRRLPCDRTSRVSLQTTSVRVNNVPQQAICIDTNGKSLKFGTMIPQNPKTYIAAVTRQTVSGMF